MPAVVALARAAMGGFNPLSLSPVYMTHTDASTVVSGAISAITDRVAGYSFSQGTASARPIADTSTVPGHTVWKFDGSTTARRYLLRTDATLAGALDGPVAYTLATFLKVVQMTSLGTPDLVGHTLNTTSYGNPSVRFGLTTTGIRAVISGSARNQTLTKTPVTFSGGWQLLAMTYSGSTEIKWFLDDASLGTTPLLTPGTISDMASVILGDATTINSGVTREYYVGGHFCCLGQLSSANLTNLATWFRGSFGV
jgi:hypothetical protein